MTDREKVIKGLDSCGSDLTELDKGCRTCPYYEFSGHTEYDFDFTCIRMLSRDAIELLKEQEAVKPEYEGDSRSSWWWVCGECHGPICDVDKFCRHCGREIDWNEQEKRNKEAAAGGGR